MDEQTLNALADMICEHPVYRTGTDLTHFFKRVGFPNYEHDGTTRRWWTLGVLRQLSEKDLKKVILRLGNPREYQPDQNLTSQAISKLNSILSIEGKILELDGIEPKLNETTPYLNDQKDEPKSSPLPPPDFLNLKLEHRIGEILSNRWDEAQQCMNAKAHLAATIIMGSILEGMLLAVLLKFPDDGSCCKTTPKDKKSGEVKKFNDWSLSEMIDVAHEVGWIDLDIKKFSHSLRQFRNLIHPYEQMKENTFPDEDTNKIVWQVVQATANDLARKLT